MSSSLPRKSYARIPVNIKLPNLIEVQLDSFERLKREGLGDLFHEVSPIESYNKGMKLYFPSRSPEAKQWGLKYWFGEPKHTIEECVERDLTYASLYMFLCCWLDPMSLSQSNRIFSSAISPR